MESKSTAGRFTLGRQSSLAPEQEEATGDGDELELPEAMVPPIRLMYLASEGDLGGIEEFLDAGASVNFEDIDGRTALHVAACQGHADIVDLLLRRGARVDSKDRWGSTPLADAIYYKNHDVIQLLEKHGAKLLMAPMHIQNARVVPEYEIDPKELDFTDSIDITKGAYRVALWRGTQVAVKQLEEDFFNDEHKVWLNIDRSIHQRAFLDELALLQKIRHPNVVQFLGAVTQSSPMMIVIEYLSKDDLCAFLKKKGALKPAFAVRFALDIARGKNYLHEHKPEAIIHLDLEPSITEIYCKMTLGI